MILVYTIDRPTPVFDWRTAGVGDVDLNVMGYPKSRNYTVGHNYQTLSAFIA